MRHSRKCPYEIDSFASKEIINKFYALTFNLLIQVENLDFNSYIQIQLREA